jgi:hypothetical protein
MKPFVSATAVKRIVSGYYPYHQQFLKEKGIEFENRIYSEILDLKSVESTRFKERCEETISLIEEGHPYIKGATFIDTANCTHGIMDLLIRNDRVPFPELKLEKEHYSVVEIKYSFLVLTKDKRIIDSSRFITGYKCQTCVYNTALKSITSYLPRYSFIRGKNGFGIVDYHDTDKHIPSLVTSLIKKIEK